MDSEFRRRTFDVAISVIVYDFYSVTFGTSGAVIVYYYVMVFSRPTNQVVRPDTTSHRCGEKKKNILRFLPLIRRAKCRLLPGRVKKKSRLPERIVLVETLEYNNPRSGCTLIMSRVYGKKPTPPRSFNDDPRSSSSLLSAKTASETGTTFARARDVRDDSREVPFGSLRGCRLIYADFTRRPFDYTSLVREPKTKRR